MSGFYEVTTASGCGGGRRVHEKAPVWAGCCVSHPAADRTLAGASDAAAPSPSPLAPRARYEDDGPTALTEPAGTNDATQLLPIARWEIRPQSETMATMTIDVAIASRIPKL